MNESNGIANYWGDFFSSTVKSHNKNKKIGINLTEKSSEKVIITSVYCIVINFISEWLIHSSNYWSKLNLLSIRKLN